MELDPDLFDSLHDDLEICRDYLKQVSNMVLKSEVSQYPIFVAFREDSDVDLGIPIIRKAEFDIAWSFNISHLEDFVNKSVILKEKTEEFRKNYKDPTQYLCVFVVDETAGSFIFMPFSRSKKK